jgi:hypothetical protein
VRRWLAAAGRWTVRRRTVRRRRRPPGAGLSRLGRRPRGAACGGAAARRRGGAAARWRSAVARRGGAGGVRARSRRPPPTPRRSAPPARPPAHHVVSHPPPPIAKPMGARLGAMLCGGPAVGRGRVREASARLLGPWYGAGLTRYNLGAAGRRRGCAAGRRPGGVTSARNARRKERSGRALWTAVRVTGRSPQRQGREGWAAAPARRDGGRRAWGGPVLPPASPQPPPSRCASPGLARGWGQRKDLVPDCVVGKGGTRGAPEICPGAQAGP